MSLASIGRLCVVSRRHVRLWTEQGVTQRALLASKDLEACVGDLVEYRLPESGPRGARRRGVGIAEPTVERLLPRRNCLKRALGKKTKLLAANVDHLLLVTAPLPLFNTAAIDRVLCAAALEGIPSTLVLNKADLVEAREQTEPLCALYRRLGVSVLEVSAETGLALEQIHALLGGNDVEVAVLTGVSGVGKSSLLKALLPEAEVRTREVSRTGQGRQTTSQAVGFRYPRPDGRTAMLVDLPGIQHFGISHLTAPEIRNSFVEFHTEPNCKFADCTHINEPECQVQEALKRGEIAESRYRSYLQMLEELERYREY